jgi:hypothetical protein
VALLFSPGRPGQLSILVSANDQTYLEAVTENHGEGFLDGYDWLAVYYIQVGGWFQDTRRVKVYDNPHDSASNVGFRRSLDHYGHPQIVVYHYAMQDSTAAFVFTIPRSFGEFTARK